MGGRGRVKGWCWEGRGIEKKLKNAFSERPQAFPARDQSWALKAEGGRWWGGDNQSTKRLLWHGGSAPAQCREPRYEGLREKYFSVLPNWCSHTAMHPILEWKGDQPLPGWGTWLVQEAIKSKGLMHI